MFNLFKQKIVEMRRRNLIKHVTNFIDQLINDTRKELELIDKELKRLEEVYYLLLEVKQIKKEMIEIKNLINVFRERRMNLIEEFKELKTIREILPRSLADKDLKDLEQLVKFIEKLSEELRKLRKVEEQLREEARFIGFLLARIYDSPLN